MKKHGKDIDIPVENTIEEPQEEKLLNFTCLVKKKIEANFSLDIFKARLLTDQEYEEHKGFNKEAFNYSGRWWIDQPDIMYKSLGHVVDPWAGHIEKLFVGSGAAIRPVLEIALNDDFEVGDSFKFGNRYFTILSPNLAMCNSDIRPYTMFDPISNEFEKSKAKVIIDEWFEKSKEAAVAIITKPIMKSN